MQFILDGSQKGMVIGAGIVKVNSFGFIQNFSFTNYHINPNSCIAEIFAFEKALDLISEDLLLGEEVIIYTDHTKVFKLFSTDIQKGELSLDPYELMVQEALLSLLGSLDIQVLMVNEQVKPLVKVAHNLSRQYLSDKNTFIMANLNPSKDHSSKDTPSEKIHLDIVRDSHNKHWYLLVNGKEIGHSNSFLDVVANFVLSEIKEKECVIVPSAEMERMLHAIKKNKKAQDILEKIHQRSA